MEKKLLNQLKVEIKNQGLTYKNIAYQLGLTENSIAKLLAGDTKLTLSRLKLIVDILQVDTELIIGNTTIKL